MLKNDGLYAIVEKNAIYFKRPAFVRYRLRNFILQ